MSEAATPNNEQDLPESSQLNQAIDSSADLTDSSGIPVNQLEAFQLVDSTEQPTSSEQPDLAPVEELADLVDFGETDKSPIRELAEALTWQSDTDVAELVSLSQSLQQQNTDLLTHVEQLEKLLDECHSALQLQMKRNQSLETRLSQQAQELTATQEQMTRLFRELEASHHVAQRQQILIETLTQQLENSQEQVARLERECALARASYNEQSYNLSQSENTCQELRSRLDRQQRYSLQLKAALDKFIDLPAHLESNPEAGNLPATAEIQYYPQNASARLRLLLKPQPIQPWSASLEDITAEAIAEPPDSSLELPLPTPWQEENPEEVSPNLEILAEDQQEALSEPLANTIVPRTESESDLPDLLPLPVESANDLSENLDAAEEVLWEELERLTEAAVKDKLATAGLSETPITAPAPVESDLDEEKEEPVSQSEETPATGGELVLPRSYESSIVPVDTEEFDTAQAPNWPSPVVYPTRSQKKIKSLAAIDLPSFPRLSTQPSAPAK
jgi:myosin heavy subunit